MNKQDVDLLAALQNKQKGGNGAKYTKFRLSNGKQFVVCGEVHNDGRWADGTLIHTSLVEKIHEDEKILETRNTYYTLGDEVAEDSEERSRLLSAL